MISTPQMVFSTLRQMFDGARSQFRQKLRISANEHNPTQRS
jgi:hypothetical protein